MTGNEAVCLWLGLVTALIAGPYLARLTLSVPDRDDRLWYRGHDTTFGREIVTLVLCLLLVLLAVLTTGPRADVVAFVVLALVCTPLVIIDIEHHRLPDRLTVVGYVCASLGLGGAAVAESHPGALLRAALAGAAVAACFLLLALASPTSLGLGDVKLVGLLGIYLGWLGWTEVVTGMLYGFVLGALASLVLVAARRATMKTAVAFGPTLIIGSFLAAALS